MKIFSATDKKYEFKTFKMVNGVGTTTPLSPLCSLKSTLLPSSWRQ